MMIDVKNTSKDYLIMLFIQIAKHLNILSISDMARFENKSHQGITKSKRYLKLKIGNTTLCYKK